MSKVWLGILMAFGSLASAAPAKWHITTSTTGPYDVLFASWSPQNDVVAISDRHAITVWNLSSNSQQTINNEQGFNLQTPPAWSPDGSKFVTTHNGYPKSEQCAYQLWDSKTATLLATLTPNSLCNANSVAWSPDGTKLATASRLEAATSIMDALFDIWDSMGNHIGSLDSIAFLAPQSLTWNKDGTQIASANAYNPSLGRTWDVDSGKRIFNLTLGLTDTSIRAVNVEWSPNGEKIALLYTNGEIGIWDAKTGQHLVTVYSYGSTYFEWSPDSGKIIGSGGTALAVIDATSGNAIWYQYASMAKWNPNGKEIALFNNVGNIVWICDAATGVVM